MWIHEHDTWPEFTWSMSELAGILAQLRHEQGRLFGRMQGLGFELKTEAKLGMLTDDVVKSSAIEGEHLDSEEVRSSIARRLGIDIAGCVPASRDVEGVVEMMLDATENYAAELTKDRLFAWHASLFPTGRSGMHEIQVGAWRGLASGPMQVVSGPIGREKVHFEAPRADYLDREMQVFLNWFNKNNIDPVLKAGVAHFWFVTIHPFEDGNGRIARAISDMALARADLSSERFYSLSSQLEAERRDYYRQLARQQRGDIDITRWLNWFLSCVGRAIANAETKLKRVLHKSKVWDNIRQQPVNDRQKIVINRMLDDNFEGFMRTSKYAKLAKCSTDTALRDLRQLVEWGVLVQNSGRGRSTSYRINEHT